jgi:hypothetical protein
MAPGTDACIDCLQKKRECRSVSHSRTSPAPTDTL